MTDMETLEERVSTVERAVTDGDHGFPAVDDLAELTERVAALEQQVAELDDRADELEAATQALRGYVGNVRSVNERVEGRADAALAATERLERRLDAADGGHATDTGRADRHSTGAAEPRDDPAGRDDRGSSDSTHNASGIGGTDPGLSGVDGRENGDGGGTADSRDPGVLGRIRSLL